MANCAFVSLAPRWMLTAVVQDGLYLPFAEGACDVSGFPEILF